MAKKKKYGAVSTSRRQPARIERTIYIGPNLPGGQLSAFTVFKGELPAHVRDLREKTPELQRLFVPVSDLAAARQRLQKAGPEAQAFRAVRKKFNL